MPIDNMTIITNEFTLTRSNYFLILLLETLRRRWWVFLIFFLFSALGYEKGIASVILLFVTLSTAYFIYLIARIWLQASPKKTPFLFLPCTCTINHEALTAIYAGEGTIKFNFGAFQRIVKRKNYYLFYLGSRQFVCFPLNTLTNPQEIERLDVLVKVKTA